jgi:predicted CoA-binding protein
MAEFCEIPKEMPSDETIRSILAESKTIAVVGISARPDRDSHRVAAYLQEEGYRIIPVNPTLEEVLGEKAYPSLEAIPEPVDVVDVFRKPEAVPEIVDAAIRIGAKAIWMQEGVVHNAAAEKGKAAGLRVVMDRCMLKEHQRHDLS